MTFCMNLIWIPDLNSPLVRRLEPASCSQATADQRFELALRSWVATCCATINGFGRKPGKVHRAALADMGQKIRPRRFLAGDETPNSCFEEVIVDLKNKLKDRITPQGNFFQ